MSISTPNPNSGKDETREDTKENAAPPRPSARRQRRGSGSSAKRDETATEATPATDAAEQPADDGQASDAKDAAAPEGSKPQGAAEGDEVAARVTDPTAFVSHARSEFDPTPAPQASGRRGLFGVEGSGDTSGMGGLVTQAGSGIPSVSSPRPYGGWFDEVADIFAKAYPQWNKAHLATMVDRGEITFYVEKSHIAKIMQIARDNSSLRFELLSSLSGVDYYRGDGGVSSTGDPQQDEYRKQRLHVVYHLTSMTFRRRVRFEVATTVEDPHVPTVSEVYPTADWQERETYDMFGVIFDGHHALTRILMPDDWNGFPQRKDYPLGGIDVEYKGASIPPPDQRRSYK
ncbi:NADH-quinone oxidoreductase subunit C [Cumulibacter soli]|uniref:NADH-quinone oxidoreductase subunit C n=1 Tax=Cumulibacter soli TaxID=2546344 RepID=UPI0010689EDA|nr:NADH-quinone oxidoreductase subunit C [Cumulibacter soli]